MSSSDDEPIDEPEYRDHVHENLKYVPVYSKGTFSCSSLDDFPEDDEDEDVKRILAEHGRPEPGDREGTGFSSAYRKAAEAIAGTAADLSSAEDAVIEDGGGYEDWDDALADVSAVYPALGVGRAVTGTLEYRNPGDPDPGGFRCRPDADTDNRVDTADRDRPAAATTARELRKCLEGALYGRDADDFVVAQPYRVADKNLDFGKPKMSAKTVLDSRKKVEGWMNKYVVGGDEYE